MEGKGRRLPFQSLSFAGRTCSSALRMRRSRPIQHRASCPRAAFDVGRRDVYLALFCFCLPSSASLGRSEASDGTRDVVGRSVVGSGPTAAHCQTTLIYWSPTSVPDPSPPPPSVTCPKVNGTKGAVENGPPVTTELQWKGQVWVLAHSPRGGGGGHHHLVTLPSEGLGVPSHVLGGLCHGEGQYANNWAPLTRKRHTMPHSAQPQHANYWAPRTRKRHQQEHRPQRPPESSDPTQHAKGRTGDCPGPCKGATTGRNVTQGGGGRASLE